LTSRRAYRDADRHNRRFDQLFDAERESMCFGRLIDEEVAVQPGREHIAVVVAERHRRDVAVLTVVDPASPVRTQLAQVLLIQQHVRADAAVLEAQNRFLPASAATRRTQAAIAPGSAIAEGPRDAQGQLKSCQLLRSCTKNLI